MGSGGGRTRRTKRCLCLMAAPVGVGNAGSQKCGCGAEAVKTGLWDEGCASGCKYWPSTLPESDFQKHMWLSDISGQRLARGQGCQECPAPGFVGHTDTVLFTDWNNSLLLWRSIHMKVCSFYFRNIRQFISGMRFCCAWWFVNKTRRCWGLHTPSYLALLGELIIWLFWH